jgi:hypothetical protein
LGKIPHPANSPDLAYSDFGLLNTWRANITEWNSTSSSNFFLWFSKLRRNRLSADWIKFLKNGCDVYSNIIISMVPRLNEL